LVHCRVGVSRSASICIAEVMRRTSLSLPRAYLFVRARRLNVIIQPNLRFMYELMKWEEFEFARNLERRVLDPFADTGEQQREYKREMEWAWLCKEIADLNKTYTVTS
jgi:dual specificity MAP kinase phosphatase